MAFLIVPNANAVLVQFQLHDNGVTVTCEGASSGASDWITINEEEVKFTAVTETTLRNMINNKVDVSQVCTSLVEEMNDLFLWAPAFNDDISSWDVSNVTDMSYMFSGVSSFNKDISKWDVSSVTNMYQMFYDSNFNGDISSWDVSSVTDMERMFEATYEFNQDIGDWNVSNVTTMNRMFEASYFNQSIGNWNVSKVTNFYGMFYGAEEFNHDLSGWCVENIADIPDLFDIDSGFEGVVEVQPQWGTCPTQHKIGKAGDTEAWYMLASPSTDTYQHFLSKVWTQGAIGAKYAGLDAPSNINVYNINTNTYAPVTDLTVPITPGSGFLVYMYESDDYESEGTFPKRLKITKTKLNPDVDYDLTELVHPVYDSSYDSWSLLGNPYVAPIFWDAIDKDGVYDVVYVYDGSEQEYLAYNSVQGHGLLEDGEIGAYTGFWVVREMSFGKKFKITSDSRNNPNEKTTNQSASFKIVADMGEMSDQMFFTFTKDGALDGDSRDALKLEPLDFHSHLSMGTVVNGETMSINNLPLEFDGEAEYALSINALKASEDGYMLQSGEVTLKAENFKNLPESWDVFVNNYNTGERVNLREVEDYTFMLSPKQKVMASSAPRSILTPPAPSPSKAKIAEESGITISITAGDTPTSNEIEDGPAVFALEQNYPNPFNPSTTIKYSVADAGHVSLTIYNVMGQKVAELVNTTKTAGAHTVQWQAGTAASGMYFYKLKSGGQTLTKQMMLIK